MAVLKYKKKDGSYATLTNISVKPIEPVQTTGHSVTDIMSQNAVTVELENKLAISDFNTYSGTVDTAIGNKASQSDLSTLSGTVTAHTADTDIHVTTSDKETWNTVTNKVDKVEGKALSKNDFTDAYKDKLDSVASGAEVNVQADWAETATTADSFIQNKPTLGTAAAKGVSNGITNSDNLIESKYIYSGVGVTISYDTESKYIQLKSISGNVLSSFDASAFLVDGMIDSVELETKSGTTYLVITWNTAAGKSKTELNIGDIFEADNYLTKEQLTATTDYTTVTKANSANTASTVALDGVTGADDLKAIEALNGTSGLLKKTAANTWALDTTSYSSATEVSNALATKSDTGHTHDDRYYTESEINNKIGAMSAITAGSTSKTITALSESDGVISATYADINITKSQISDFAHNQASNTITGMTSYSKPSTTSAIDTGDTLNQAIGKLETALDSKSNSGHTHDDRYYTESEIDGKIGAMSATTSGSAAKTITALSETNGVISATYADISITKSQISDFAHNQASNTITAMTSYSVASASGSVSTSDSLNVAIGKLEKRLQLLEAAIGGMTLVKLTSQQYADLTTKDANTLYIIND